MSKKWTTSEPRGVAVAVKKDAALAEAVQRAPETKKETQKEWVFVGGGRHFVAVQGRKEKAEIEFQAANKHLFVTSDKDLADALIAKGFKQAK